MNNKGKRILALTSAVAILVTSMPINAFAESGQNNGLEIGPEIGVHSNIRSYPELKPKIQYKWKKYNIKNEYVLKYVGKGETGASLGGCSPVSSYTIMSDGKFYGHGSARSGKNPVGYYIFGYPTPMIDGLRFMQESRTDHSNPGPGGTTMCYDLPTTHMLKITGTREESYGRFSHIEIMIGDIYSTTFTSTKGSYAGQATSEKEDFYSKNGPYGSYWYEYIGSEVSQNIASQYNSPTQAITVDYNQTYNIEDGILDEQPGARVEDVTSPKIDTKVSGDKTAKAKITFSDNSTKIVNVSIHVNPSESENFNDKNKDNGTIHVDSKTPIEVVKGKQPNLTYIVNEIENKDKHPDVKNVTTPDADTTKTGKGKAEVIVEFNDGSKTTIEVPINVINPESVEFKEDLQTIIALKGENLAENVYKKAITNLPSDLKDFKVTTSLDTSKSGDPTAKVSLTFKDDSTKEITLKSKVLEVPRTKTVDWGKELKLTEGIVGLSDKDKVEDITSPAINTKESGNKTGKIKVTLGSGETREFEIEVKVNKSESETNTNIGSKQVTVPWGEVFDIKQGITNLPNSGESVKDISTNKVNTKQSGNYIAKAEVTFADGSTKTVDNILVIVSKSEAENFTEQVIKEEIKRGGIINLLNNITNLPKGASVKDITDSAIDTKEVGTFTGKVEITFSDGSTKQVEIPVEISKLAAEEFTPVVNKEEVAWGKTVDLTDNITNLLEGAKVEDITNPAIDTTKSGEYKGKVRVTFTDKSTKEVEIPVEVKKSDSENFIPKVNTEEIIKGNPIDLTDNITNLPEGTQIKDITNPSIDITKPGTYTGKVEITFPDGSKKEIEIPVKVVLTAGMIVPVPEITKENILPEVVGWGKAIDLTDNIKNLPDGATIRDITSPVIDTKQAGTYTAKAEVAFKDGSKRVVNIPVTVNKSEAETFVPNVKYVTVKRTRPYKLTDSITNIPGNAEVKINQQIDVSKIGGQNEIITITFSDGSIRQLNMPVEVVSLESDGFIAQTETIVVDWGKPLNPSEGIKNLPDGATVVEITDPKVDTKVSGNKNAEAKIIFSDESIKEVTIPVTVNKSESENFANKFNKETDIIPEEVIKGNSIDLSDNIKNLPNNVTVENITDPAIDTNNPGKYIATAKVIFSDGSTMTVEIPVKVVIKAGMITPVPSVGKSDIEDENVNWSGEIDLTDNVKNLPDGATVKDITEPKIDTTKPGEYTGKVEITFPDGSKRTVEVPIIVDKSQAEKYEENPKIEEEKVARNGKVDLTDNIKDLPEGTKVVDTTKDKIDTSKLGTSTGTVEVTFPDGSKQEFEVPIKVYKTEAEAFENPIITREVVKKGENVDLTDNVVNLPEGAKVVDTTEPAIDTNKVGEYTAKAKIVFKDGSEKEIEVEVVVTDGKINHNDNNGDGYTSGVIGNDTTGSCNGPTNFNVKSDGYTPEYKTKSDENNQESKHKTLDNLLNNLSNLGKRNDIKSNENTTKYVFKIGEKSYKTIHGDNVTSHKMDVAPYIKNDRTMMPLRYVAEAIGADVQWDNSTRTAIFEKDGLAAKIQIDGNKIVMSNGQVYEMDAKPDNINDRILVSITNVSKVFNLTNGHTKDGVNQNIEWNNDNRTVTIVK